MDAVLGVNKQVFEHDGSVKWYIPAEIWNP
jgi:hypothetical protein